MKKNEKSIFSFIPEESSICYKEIPLITQDIKILNDQMASKNSKYKPSFFYDKYTNQFIYINGEAVIILDSKLTIKTFTRVEIKEKIKSISIEYHNKYLLYTTYNCKSIIIDLLDLDTIDCFENQKAQYLGGFFIPYKTPEKEHNYFILCMISRTYFSISRIKKCKDEYNEFQYSSQLPFISNKMKIIDFNFNHIFKMLLIIKADPFSFCLYNLKSKSCYKTPITMNGIKLNNVNENKLYLQNIYKKLYIINMNSSGIEVYKLKDFKEIKEPIIINFNINRKKNNIKNIHLQFYNNLIIVYMEWCIKLYDIKSNNYEIYILNITKDQYYNTFYQTRIIGKYLKLNNIFYKVKFLNLNYKKYSKFCSKDIFFTILRRKNTNHIIKQIIFEILNNFQISKLLEIVEGLIVNNKKYIDKRKKYEKYKDIKNDPYTLINLGNNGFFLSEDYLLSIFNQFYDKSINTESFLKILGYLYYMYQKSGINLDSNLFYSSLFYQLNKIDNMTLIDFFIKNKIIPINERLGIYFIIRANGFKDSNKYNECFNIGLDILLHENKYDDKIIIQIAEEFINNKKYSDCFNLICDNYFQRFLPVNKLKK